MSGLKKYNANEFENYINSINISRNISLIQLHHTYSPAYKQFTGNNHMQLHTSMRNYHINSNGWSDIAQHFTIFPDGVIVSGRSLEIVPAGIKGANTGAICIECLGNFDHGGDVMTDSQKNAIVSVVKSLLKKFNLNAETSVVYHCWWTAGGTALGDYVKTKSAKTCPGTNFFGGNSKEAFRSNFLPLLLSCSGENEKQSEIKEITEKLSAKGILSDKALWIKKCSEDINVYWLCKKMANHLK